MNIDQVVDKISALTVPAIVFIVVSGSNAWTGAAATTAALAALGGPAGMFGGLAALGILGLISQAIAKYGSEELLKALVSRSLEEGKSIQDIQRKVNGYPISKELKLKIKNHLEQLTI